MPASRRRRAGLSLLALSVALGGCSTMPSPGPLAPTINHEAAAEAPPFLLVPVSREVLAALAAVPPETFGALATPRPAPLQTIQVGDVVSVTLWEYGSGLFAPNAAPGSFASSGAQSVSIPNQAVDQSGYISVPFAGDVMAAGRTPREVQKAIKAALRGNANDVQVLVNIAQTNDNAVTVSGDVNHPGRFPLALSGTHVLDAIATAGGSTARARDMTVQLTRGSEVRRVRMTALLADPAQNIFLQPGDIVALDQEQQSVVVLGATNKNMEVPFSKAQLTLAEALGNGGGLADQQADPYGVYVFRYETPSIARTLRGDGIPPGLDGGPVPVVFQINLKATNGLFLAQAFQLSNRDLVYVSNSPSVQIGKLARLFNGIASIFKRNSVNAF